MPHPPMRALLVSLIAVGLLLAVVAALTGLLLLLALIVALAVLNMIYLPRVAARLHLPLGILALMLVPFMVLLGVLIGGVPGAGWAIGIWVGAIGLPRVIGRELTRRARRGMDARLGYFDVTPRATSGDASVRTPTADPGGRPLPPADDRGPGEYGP